MKTKFQLIMFFMMGFSDFAQTAAREGVTFKRTVDADCVPRTGNYDYPATEATVSIEKGSITKIVNPAADRTKAAMQQTNDAHTATTCTRCNGKGVAGYSRVSVSNTSEIFGVDRYLNGRYTTTTRYGDKLFQISAQNAVEKE